MANAEFEKSLRAIVDGNIAEVDFGPEGLKDMCMLFLLSSENPEEKLKIARNFLSALFGAEQDAIDDFLGIKTLEKAESFQNGEDCFEYFFGKGADSAKILDDLIYNYDISLDPKVGAYALYLDKNIEHPLHIGKVVEGERVVSKWGPEGNVFEHEPMLVPVAYGNMIAYLMRKD